MSKYVIITGDFNEGLQKVYGLFNSEDEAELYSDCHNLDHWDKFVRELTIITDNDQSRFQR